MVFLPPSIVAYGWVIQERVHVAAPCVFLFLCGLFSVCVSDSYSKVKDRRLNVCTRWIYSSTLAYIVDSNAGRSSSAVATNSLFRGIFAFVAAEVAVPLQVGYCIPHEFPAPDVILSLTSHRIASGTAGCTHSGEASWS